MMRPSSAAQDAIASSRHRRMPASRTSWTSWPSCAIVRETILGSDSSTRNRATGSACTDSDRLLAAQPGAVPQGGADLLVRHVVLGIESLEGDSLGELTKHDRVCRRAQACRRPPPGPRSRPRQYRFSYPQRNSSSSVRTGDFMGISRRIPRLRPKILGPSYRTASQLTKDGARWVWPGLP
jgi:hypothetical protein